MILSGQSLSKQYGPPPGYAAVHEASLDLHDGDFVSIVGRSGSGKSTLMAMLGALTRPSQGKLLLDGTDVWTFSERALADFRCRRIGFIFQFPSLLPNLSAVDNVAVPALLGSTLDAPAAYARAHRLLDHVGLAKLTHSYPHSMSGGEQRRVVIARALINSPRFLLADEPTGDLDEDTESEIVDVLQELHETESFGLILVTHNLELAKRARQTYEMHQGALAEIGRTDMARGSNHPPRRPAAAGLQVRPEPMAAAAAPIGLGSNLWPILRTVLLGVAIVFPILMLLDFGVGKYQAMQARERLARSAALQHLALNSLRGDVASITDLGGGRYGLTTYLENVGGGQPIYVQSPDLRAYVQVGTGGQEVPIKTTDQSAGGVLRIEGRQTYHFVFDPQVREFTQLLPNYMHVRFSGTMLVSPSSIPMGDVFERKDNYYVYLKPFDIADEVVLKRMRFSGKPPVWIPMPPH